MNITWNMAGRHISWSFWNLAGLNFSTQTLGGITATMVLFWYHYLLFQGSTVLGTSNGFWIWIDQVYVPLLRSRGFSKSLRVLVARSFQLYTFHMIIYHWMHRFILRFCLNFSDMAEMVNCTKIYPFQTVYDHSFGDWGLIAKVFGFDTRVSWFTYCFYYVWRVLGP